MTAWPSDLPFFDMRQGFSQSGPQNAKLRTSMDAGPEKVRPRFTAAPKAINGQTGQLTEAQLADFEDFYATDLGMGSLSFTRTYAVTGTVKTFRFVGGYSVTPFGQGYRVSAQLEILP